MVILISARWGPRCGSLMAEETGMLVSRRAPAGTQPLSGCGSWVW